MGAALDAFPLRARGSGQKSGDRRSPGRSRRVRAFVQCVSEEADRTAHAVHEPSRRPRLVTSNVRSRLSAQRHHVQAWLAHGLAPRLRLADAHDPWLGDTGWHQEAAQVRPPYTPASSLTVCSAVDGYLQREREQRRQAMCVGDRRRGAGLTRWAAVDSTRRGWSWRRRPRSRPSVPRRTPVRRRARRTRVLTCADGEGMTLEKLEAAVVEQGKVFPRCVRVCSIAFRDRSTRSVARRLMIELADTWTGIGRS